MNCNDAATLVSAYVDGETSRLQSHSIKRHLRTCAACAAKYEALTVLRARIRAEAPRHAAPAALRARVLATADALRPAAPGRGFFRDSRWRWLTGGMVAGCAATMLTWSVGTAVIAWRVNEDVAVEAVTTHVRATLGNHLIQVASSNQHTVKPWLSARLDYSPPVPDMTADGFTLVGGRIDYLDRRPIATLVYRIRDHNIDVFVCPSLARVAPSAMRTVRGFNIAHAKGTGMDWLAVSDLNPDELASFVQKLAEDAGPR